MDNQYEEQSSQVRDSRQLPFNRLQLQDKIIEPENEIFERPFNRNLQLGFIDKTSHAILAKKLDISDMLKGIPSSQGGFIFHQIGELLQSQVNTFLIMSNSVSGRGRQGLFTAVSRTEFKDVNQAPKFSSFGRSE